MNDVVVEPVLSEIIFFCKGCRAFVEAERIGSKYVYKCLTCKSEDVAFGTKKSLENFYRVKK